MSENGDSTDNGDQQLIPTSSPGRAFSPHSSAAAASLARLNSSSPLASSIASAEERLQSEMHGGSLTTVDSQERSPETTTATTTIQRALLLEPSLTLHDRTRLEQQQNPLLTTDIPDRGDLVINIRFGEGPDLSLHVARTDTVAEVKEKIKAARPTIAEKYLRLIHAGKVLMDEKTMIESLPKSLFTHYEIPGESTSARSRISTSLEAAVSHILTSHPHHQQQQHHHEASRSSLDSIRGVSGSGVVRASLGGLLPTHIIRPETSSIFSSGDETPASIPSSANGKGKSADYISITMPDDEQTASASKTISTTNGTNIPLQTGPIYILCSLSDIPPNQRSSSSNTKGKAVMSNRVSPVDTSSGTMTSTRTGRVRHGGGGNNTFSRGRIGEGTSSSAPLLHSNQQGGRGERPSRNDDDDNENSEENTALLSPVMAPAAGFDRLREAGFSEDEIRSIRREFHASRRAIDSSTSRVGENGFEIDQGEDTEARARRIEDEWIDQHGSETLPEGLEGSYGEMVWGLMLGFFMGLITLFWFKEATFTRRQQMGIVAGMTLNIVFGILRFL